MTSTDSDRFSDSMSVASSVPHSIVSDMHRHRNTVQSSLMSAEGRSPRGSGDLVAMHRSMSRSSSTFNRPSTPNSGAIEGYLDKKGAWLAGYSPRYVKVAKDGSLAYYVNESSAHPRGVIQLKPVATNAVSVSSVADEDAGLFVFSVRASGASRLYLFRTQCADERNEWISTINEVTSAQARQVMAGTRGSRSDTPLASLPTKTGPTLLADGPTVARCVPWPSRCCCSPPHRSPIKPHHDVPSGLSPICGSWRSREQHTVAETKCRRLSPSTRSTVRRTSAPAGRFLPSSPSQSSPPVRFAQPRPSPTPSLAAAT